MIQLMYVSHFLKIIISNRILHFNINYLFLYITNFYGFFRVIGTYRPTIWDVLIALFGGLAGIIGITRKEKSNVIPGVAIATALMPPLCTAGYGIATHSLKFFSGALYLFCINGVFYLFINFYSFKIY